MFVLLLCYCYSLRGSFFCTTSCLYYIQKKRTAPASRRRCSHVRPTSLARPPIQTAWTPRNTLHRQPSIPAADARRHVLPLHLPDLMRQHPFPRGGATLAFSLAQPVLRIQKQSPHRILSTAAANSCAHQSPRIDTTTIFPKLPGDCLSLFGCTADSPAALCGSDSPLPPHGHPDSLAQVSGRLLQPPRMYRRLAGHAAVAVTAPCHRTNKKRPLSAAAPFLLDQKTSFTCRSMLGGSLMQPLALPQCNHRVLWSPALDWGWKRFRPPDKGRTTQRRECSSGRNARLPPRENAL